MEAGIVLAEAFFGLFARGADVVTAVCTWQNI
jgi:hypothetical protein